MTSLFGSGARHAPAATGAQPLQPHPLSASLRRERSGEAVGCQISAEGPEAVNKPPTRLQGNVSFLVGEWGGHDKHGLEQALHRGIVALWRGMRSFSIFKFSRSS